MSPGWTKAGRAPADCLAASSVGAHAAPNLSLNLHCHCNVAHSNVTGDCVRCGAPLSRTAQGAGTVAQVLAASKRP